MKFPHTLLLWKSLAFAISAKKNLIVDTDLFSDVDDAGALLLAATSPDTNLLAVNVNTHTRYSALAASAILAHYGQSNVPIGISRPLTNATFFDSWYYELGEYASKIAYHFSGGSLLWGHAEDAWDPVELYRKVLAESEDGSVTIVSIGFLDNVWPALSGGPLMADGPKSDPVRMAYIYYSYFVPRPSWDPLAVLYAIHDLGAIFKLGNKYGYNHIEPNGTNRWVWDERTRNQFFLRLKAKNETAAACIDKLFLQGSLTAMKHGTSSNGRKLADKAKMPQGFMWLAYRWLCSATRTVVVWSRF